MMLSESIANALFVDCQDFGIPVYRRGNIPTGEVTSERVVILPKGVVPNTYWRKCFVEVNLCVPDLSPNQANLMRLGVLENMAAELLDGRVGRYDDEYYRYSISSIGIEDDSALKCHFVNVRILFEVLNC